MKIKGLTTILMLTVLLLTSLEAVSQVSVSVVAGPDINFIGVKKFKSPVNRSRSLFGYVTGVGVGYNIHKKLLSIIRIEIIQKNYELVRNDSIPSQFQFSNTFIQIPVSLQWQLYEDDHWNFNIFGGGFVSYQKSARVNAVFPNVFDSNTDDHLNVHANWVNVNSIYEFTNSDRRFEYGMSVGVTLGYSLNSRTEVTSTLSAYQSLSNLRSDNSPSRYNSTIAGCFGILYKIGRQ